MTASTPSCARCRRRSRSPGVKLRLVAVNNDILGEAVTDADGHVRFDPGLARGTGGMAPQLVDAETDAGDYAFLDLSDPAFDLTDRGVDGRPAPAPLDVFLTPERGIYRPGETVHLTALVRDAARQRRHRPAADAGRRAPGRRRVRCARRSPTAASAATPTTSRSTATPCAARGGRALRRPEGRAARRDLGPGRGLRAGAARLRAHDRRRRRSTADEPTTHRPRRALPLRRAGAGPRRRRRRRREAGRRTLAAFPGYQLRPRRRDRRAGARAARHRRRRPTRTARRRFDVALPELPTTTSRSRRRSSSASTDTNGRAVERTLDAAGRSRQRPTIGIKPLFDGDGSTRTASPRFEVIAVAPDGRARRRRRASTGSSSGSRPTTSGTVATAAGTTS